jgi:hypothetical protein
VGCPQHSPIRQTRAPGETSGTGCRSLRGSRTTDTAARHVMAACDQASSVVLASEPRGRRQAGSKAGTGGRPNANACTIIEIGK